MNTSLWPHHMGVGKSRLRTEGTVLSNEVIRSVMQDDLPEVRTWIQSGGNVNFIDSNGYFLSMYAAYYGRQESLRELVNAGADIHLQNEDGMNVLMTATYSGHLHIINYLLSIGADPGTADRFGTTPLMFASYNGHADAVSLFVSLEVDTLARDQDHLTAYDLTRDREIRDLLSPLMSFQRRLSWLSFTTQLCDDDYVRLPQYPISRGVLQNTDLIRFLGEYL